MHYIRCAHTKSQGTPSPIQCTTSGVSTPRAKEPPPPYSALHQVCPHQEPRNPLPHTVHCIRCAHTKSQGTPFPIQCTASGVPTPRAKEPPPPYSALHQVCPHQEPRNPLPHTVHYIRCAHTKSQGTPFPIQCTTSGVPTPRAKEPPPPYSALHQVCPHQEPRNPLPHTVHCIRCAHTKSQGTPFPIQCTTSGVSTPRAKEPPPPYSALHQVCPHQEPRNPLPHTVHYIRCAHTKSQGTPFPIQCTASGVPTPRAKEPPSPYSALHQVRPHQEPRNPLPHTVHYIRCAHTKSQGTPSPIQCTTSGVPTPRAKEPPSPYSALHQVCPHQEPRNPLPHTVHYIRCAHTKSQGTPFPIQCTASGAPTPRAKEPPPPYSALHQVCPHQEPRNPLPHTVHYIRYAHTKSQGTPFPIQCTTSGAPTPRAKEPSSPSGRAKEPPSPYSALHQVRPHQEPRNPLPHQVEPRNPLPHTVHCIRCAHTKSQGTPFPIQCTTSGVPTPRAKEPPSPYSALHQVRPHQEPRNPLPHTVHCIRCAHTKSQGTPFPIQCTASGAPTPRAKEPPSPYSALHQVRPHQEPRNPLPHTVHYIRCAHTKSQGTPFPIQCTTSGAPTPRAKEPPSPYSALHQVRPHQEPRNPLPHQVEPRNPLPHTVHCIRCAHTKSQGTPFPIQCTASGVPTPRAKEPPPPYSKSPNSSH